MLKHVLRAFVPVAFMTAFAVAVAVAGEAAAPQAPETKRIGVVFIQQVFREYQYAKDTQEQMRNKFQPDQQKIEAEVLRLQEMTKALQNNPLAPPESATWRKKMMEIETGRVELQSMQEDFAKRVRDDEAVFWQNTYAAFQRVCTLYAEHYQYDVIIAAPEPALSEEALKSMDPMAVQQEIMMRRVQYVSARANLTKPILDTLNHRYQQYIRDPQRNTL